jgi:hypothetical protein
MKLPRKAAEATTAYATSWPKIRLNHKPNSDDSHQQLAALAIPSSLISHDRRARSGLQLETGALSVKQVDETMHQEKYTYEDSDHPGPPFKCEGYMPLFDFAFSRLLNTISAF